MKSKQQTMYKSVFCLNVRKWVSKQNIGIGTGCIGDTGQGGVGQQKGPSQTT